MYIKIVHVQASKPPSQDPFTENTVINKWQGSMIRFRDGTFLFYSYFVPLSLLSRYIFYTLLNIFRALDIAPRKNSCFCLVYSLPSVSPLVCCLHDRFLVLVCRLKFCFLLKIFGRFIQQIDTNVCERNTTSVFRAGTWLFFTLRQNQPIILNLAKYTALRPGRY